jgi:hypothetical protein
MYKEQAWVEKLLKRMRNEADVQSQVIQYGGVVTASPKSKRRVTNIEMLYGC